MIIQLAISSGNMLFLVNIETFFLQQGYHLTTYCILQNTGKWGNDK